jgi:lipopolysaccharide export system protein LptA
LTCCSFSYASNLVEKTEKQPVIITSETLTADNKNNMAVFEGSVVAKSGDMAMYSNKMTVFYSESENKISEIRAVGDVKVHNKERALFSEEAIYFSNEEKIVFTGNPKAVEGENVITGTEIIFYIKDDRAEVKGSRVILQNTKRLD